MREKMRKTGIRKMAAALLVTLLTAASASAGGAPEALVGSPAPVFTLADQDGKPVDYEKVFYGRHHLVLTFFPAAFTPV